MTKVIVLIVMLFAFFSCKTNKLTYSEKPDYTIETVVSSIENNAISINELRFYNIKSAMDSKKIMFDKFGKWNKAVVNPNERHPVLVWENISFFKGDSKTYSIAASGIETPTEHYTSVIVFNDKNEDCLSPTSNERQFIINYFSKSLKNVSSDDAFSKAYSPLIY